MAKTYLKGRESIIFIKYNGDWAPISCEVSNGIDETTELISTTTRDNKGWESYLPLTQGYTVSFEGQTVDEEDGTYLSYNSLVNLKRNREILQWKRESMNGKYIDAGTAIISNISDGAQAEGIITFNITLTGVGKPINTIDLVQYEGQNDTFVIYTDGENFVKFD